MTITRNILALSLFTALAACAGADTEPSGQEQGAEEPGRIEPQLIQQAMRSEYFPAARACYEALLADDAEAGGTVKVHFVIREGGAEDVVVEVSKGNLAGEEFESCMGETLAGVTFPMADGPVTVTYPIVFSPD